MLFSSLVALSQPRPATMSWHRRRQAGGAPFFFWWWVTEGTIFVPKIVSWRSKPQSGVVVEAEDMAVSEEAAREAHLPRTRSATAVLTD